MRKEQIEEWAEGPVTVALKALIENQLELLRDALKGSNCYHPGDPQKTQETLLTLIASEGVWEDMHLLVSGDWEFFESEEADEQIGD